jgi:hypothetical protein
MLEDRASLVADLTECQRVAESRLLQERRKREALVREGEERQAVLLEERNRLQVRGLAAVLKKQPRYLFC